MRIDTVTPKVKKQLMAKAHTLHPVVMIGRRGLTPAIHSEVETALCAHKLIKVKMAEGDRHRRAEMAEEMAKAHQACLVGTIGLIAMLFRDDKT